MTEVDVTNEFDVSTAPGDTAVVVLLEDNVEVIETFEQGPPGPPGIQGEKGEKGDSGSAVLYGPNDPTNAIGVDGDFYINTSTHFIFGPKAGVWPAGTSLIGPQGVPGNTILYGTVDPVAGDGIDGNFYINTTSHFMFGPKAAGAWPAGTSLIGPKGDKGDKGDQGIQGTPGAGSPATTVPLFGSSGGAIGVSTNFAREDHVHPLSQMIGAGVDLNTIKNPGTYACGNNSCINGPTVGGQWYLEVSVYASAPTLYLVQVAYDLIGSGNIWTRTLVNGSWNTWVPVATNAIRYDIAQSLTSAQQLQARQNIAAAPFDAMAYNGMQLNGGCEVDQLGLGWAGLVSGTLTYIFDGWQAMYSNATAVFQTSHQPAPFVAPFDTGMCLTSSTAMTTVGAGGFACIMQPFEGYNWKRLGFGSAAALPVTIGFWVYSSAAGTATATLRNAASNRSCPINFAVPAGVAQYVTVTFPPDVTGTWPITNALAAQLIFTFACGASLQGANGAWQAGNFLGTAATSNLFATNGNAVYISGLIVLPGIVAPNAAQSSLAIRPRQQELLLAQRYYFKVPATTFFAPGTLRAGGTAAYHSFQAPVPMRVQPAVLWPGNTAVWCGDNNAVINSASLAFQDLNQTLMNGSSQISASVGSAGMACLMYEATTALQFDARM